MGTIAVTVQRDHIERLTSAKPIAALAELIWNALDADARTVRVEFSHTGLDSLAGLVVADDGLGMTEADANIAFANLGGSWKMSVQRTKNGRILHGREGRGRFKAFALGSLVTWEITYMSGNERRVLSVRGHRTALSKFETTTAVAAASAPLGTRVIVANPAVTSEALLKERARHELAREFALYLRKYPDVTIQVGGNTLRPDDVEDHVEEVKLDPIESPDGPIEAALTIIEWKVPIDRALVLCDQNGMALAEESPAIQAPGFTFTAYLRSDYLRKLSDSKSLDVREMDPSFKKLKDAARDQLRTYFRQRAAQRAAAQVKRWKEENIYPYAGEAATKVEAAEREVFDVVAMQVSDSLSGFEKGDLRTKAFSFRLLRQAIEENPKSLQRILTEVLELPSEKRDDLAELLEKTSLGSIINAAKLVANRLEFLKGLELLVFDPVSKKVLLERKQLHRILAPNTWIFGEEFALTVDDQSLNEVLAQHRKALGLVPDPALPSAVTLIEGGTGIVDLMLSRVVPQARDDEREHLVIELKRPSVKIDEQVLTQTKKYAMTVARDERFRGTKTRWVFWALSNEVSDMVETEATQTSRPAGQVFEREGVSIWVMTWSQVIRNAQARLRYLREKLEVSPTTDSAREHLKKYYEKLIPDVVKDPAAPSSAPIPPPPSAPTPAMPAGEAASAVYAASASATTPADDPPVPLPDAGASK